MGLATTDRSSITAHGRVIRLRRQPRLRRPPAAPYCYLLGLYLGDGCISRDGRVWRLRVTLDKKYPAIIDRCCEAIDMLMPGQRAAVLRRPDRLRRSIAILQALAVPVSPARAGQEAQPTDPPGAMAASPRRPGHRGVHPRPDPQRRLPRRRQRPRRRQHPLPLLEPVRRHPRPVHAQHSTTSASPGPSRAGTSIAVYRKAATARLDEFVGPKEHGAVPLKDVHYTA